MLNSIFGKVAPVGNHVEVTPLNRFMDELRYFCEDQAHVEIYVNAFAQVTALTSNRQIIRLPVKWEVNDVSELVSELAWASNTRLDPYRPFAGGVISELNWRWHAITPPMSPDGPMLVLRRQRFSEIGFEGFELAGFVPEKLFEWLKDGTSLVVFGATGSGKTTFLVSILREFFLQNRVGIAESIQEIPLLSSNWFRLIETPIDPGGRGGVDFQRVVSEMMRLSPEVLVLGELRGAETRCLSSFARTGHGGVMATLHAGNFSDATHRLSGLSGESLDQMPSIIGLHVQRSNSGLTKVCARKLN